MNITKEQKSDLEFLVKVEIEEQDYQDNVKKELKDYQRRANVPGFRKGMAPMSLIERMYKSALVGDAVQNKLNTELFKYIDDEKLNMLGTPLANDEKTGEVDFAKGKDFTFYFDVAVAPEFDLQFNDLGVVYNQIKVTSKEVENEITQASNRYGKFETPETVGKGDILYGKLVEMDKKGVAKEGGVESFVSINLLNLKDEELLPLFEGKKVDEKIGFNMGKAFAVADVERILHMDNATAKKFKSDVVLTLSGISRIIPHEINEEFFEKLFPGQGIKDYDGLKKAMHKEIEKANAQQSDYLFVNQTRKALIDHFSAPLPEEFLKRWFVSRGDTNVTAEKINEEWAEKYLPSLKWELIEGKLEKLGTVMPGNNQIVDTIKDVLRPGFEAKEGETDEQKEARLEEQARALAANRDNINGLVDRLYAENLAKLLKEQIKPTIEKVSAKDFEERAKA